MLLAELTVTEIGRPHRLARRRLLMAVIAVAHPGSGRPRWQDPKG